MKHTWNAYRRWYDSQPPGIQSLLWGTIFGLISWPLLRLFAEWAGIGSHDDIKRSLFFGNYSHLPAFFRDCWPLEIIVMIIGASVFWHALLLPPTHRFNQLWGGIARIAYVSLSMISLMGAFCAPFTGWLSALEAVILLVGFAVAMMVFLSPIIGVILLLLWLLERRSVAKPGPSPDDASTVTPSDQPFH